MVKVASKEHTSSAPLTFCQYVTPQQPSARNTTQQLPHAKQPKQKVGRPPKTKSYETVLQLDTHQETQHNSQPIQPNADRGLEDHQRRNPMNILWNLTNQRKRSCSNQQDGFVSIQTI